VFPSLYLSALSVTADAEDLIQFDRERVRYSSIAEADVDSIAIRAAPESPGAVVTDGVFVWPWNAD
jgi:hypothetical protein